MTTEEKDEPRTKRYRVHLTGVASTTVEVEVDLGALDEGTDPMEAALEQAYPKIQATLCWQCAGRMDAPEEWVADSWTPRSEPLSENVAELS